MSKQNQSLIELLEDKIYLLETEKGELRSLNNNKPTYRKVGDVFFVEPKKDLYTSINDDLKEYSSQLKSKMKNSQV